MESDSNWLNLVYIGTAGTYDVGSLLRAQDRKPARNNDALYTDSTLALNPDTGKLIWFHQHFPHEAWDLDEAFERSLIILPIAGKARKLEVTIGKLRIIDALDRANGTYVFSKDFELNNLVTRIDARTGRRSINPSMKPEANKRVEVCPSAEGVRNWMTTSYNPQTRALFLPLQENCMDYTWQPRPKGETPAHGIDIGWSLKPMIATARPCGRLDSTPCRAPRRSALA
jgi:alcohol dehydrogenase (cytochrome c)